MEQKVYSRKFLRIKPDMPLYATACIVQVGANKVHTSTMTVRILDISQGGLRFESVLRLPADRKIILEMSLVLDLVSFCIQGTIVHSHRNKNEEFEYGFCFLEPSSDIRNSLIKMSGRMSAGLKRHIVIFRW